MKTLDKLKKGDLFTIHDIEEPQEYQVWVRDEYDRSERKYLCHNYANNSRWRYFKGNTIIFDVF